MFRSGALSGKMLLVKIVENNISDAYFRAGKGLFTPQGWEKD